MKHRRHGRKSETKWPDGRKWYLRTWVDTYGKPVPPSTDRRVMDQCPLPPEVVPACFLPTLRPQNCTSRSLSLHQLSSVDRDTSKAHSSIIDLFGCWAWLSL